MMHGVLWCVALGCGVVWSAHAMVVWWGGARCVVWCGVVWRGVPWCGAVLSVAWCAHGAVRCGAAWCALMRFGVVWYVGGASARERWVPESCRVDGRSRV